MWQKKKERFICVSVCSLCLLKRHFVMLASCSLPSTLSVPPVAWWLQQTFTYFKKMAILVGSTHKFGIFFFGVLETQNSDYVKNHVKPGPKHPSKRCFEYVLLEAFSDAAVKENGRQIRSRPYFPLDREDVFMCLSCSQVWINILTWANLKQNTRLQSVQHKWRHRARFCCHQVLH